MQSINSSLMMAWQVVGMFGCVLSLVCFVVQVNITRPYLCANHLAAPYTGLPASYAEAPSEAPPPQSASGASGEGYGAGALTLMLFVAHKRREKTTPSGISLMRSQVLHRAAQVILWHSVRKLGPSASFSSVHSSEVLDFVGFSLCT